MLVGSVAPRLTVAAVGMLWLDCYNENWTAAYFLSWYNTYLLIQAEGLITHAHALLDIAASDEREARSDGWEHTLSSASTAFRLLLVFS